MSRAFRLHSLARRLTITAVPVILVVPLVTAVAVPGSSKGSDAGQGGAAPTVNWALSGQATANSTETGYPASNAIDGDAGTDWCTSAWTGSLVVDLGQVRSLSDLGITLDAVSPFPNGVAARAPSRSYGHTNSARGCSSRSRAPLPSCQRHAPSHRSASIRTGARTD